MYNIIAQSLAGVALVLTMAGRGFKKQTTNLLFNVVSCVFFAVSYLMLGAYMGLVEKCIAIVRSLVFYLYLKKNWNRQVWLLALFSVVLTVTCCFSFTTWLDFALIMLKGLSYTYASWQHNVKVFRWLSIFSCAVTFVYDLIYLGYVLAMAELVAIAVIIAVMIKEKVSEKRIKNNQQTSEELVIHQKQEKEENPKKD